MQSRRPALRVTQSVRTYWMLRYVTSQRLPCHYEAGLNQVKSISLRMRTNPNLVLKTSDFASLASRLGLVHFPVTLGVKGPVKIA